MSKEKKVNPYKENKNQKGFVNFLTAKTPLGLALRIVLPPVIAYAYLMLCGLIFDWWLHKYSMTNFVFYSFIVISVIAVVFMIAAIVLTVKSGNLKKEKK